MCDAGRGQLLAPWPNRLEDGSYAFDGRTPSAPAQRGAEPQRDPRARALVGLDGRRARARSRRDGAHCCDRSPATRSRSSCDGVRGRGGRSDGAADRDQRRRRAVPVRLRHAPVPDGRDGDRSTRSSCAYPPARCWRRTSGACPPAPRRSPGTPFDFREPQPIGPLQLDHCFADLERSADGRATVELRDPGRGVRRTLWVDDAFPYLMVFSGDTLGDAARRSVAVEPMTCPPNAFRSGDDLVRLEPGASWTGDVGDHAGLTGEPPDEHGAYMAWLRIARRHRADAGRRR